MKKLIAFLVLFSYGFTSYANAQNLNYSYKTPVSCSGLGQMYSATCTLYVLPKVDASFVYIGSIGDWCRVVDDSNAFEDVVDSRPSSRYTYPQPSVKLFNGSWNTVPYYNGIMLVDSVVCAIPPI